MIVFQNKHGVYISFDTSCQNDCENSILWVWSHLYPNSKRFIDYSICPSDIFFTKHLWETLVDPCRPFQKNPDSKDDESYLRQFVSFCVMESAPLFAQQINSNKYIELYCRFWSTKKQFLDFFATPPKSKWEKSKESVEKRLEIKKKIDRIKKKNAEGHRVRDARRAAKKKLNNNQ